MKRYIRASYDSSIPEWLKGQQVLSDLKQQYALSEAKFYSKPQPDSIAIYLLKTAYINQVKKNWGKRYPTTLHTEVKDFAFCPEYSKSDISILVDDTYYRPVGKNMSRPSVRAAFDSLIKRKTYMVAPLRSDVRSEHYKDPRKASEYSYDKRDKSGYKIPDPRDLYTRLYAKFPDKAKDKLDSIKATLEDYYVILNDSKDKIFDIDIREGKGYDMGSRNANQPRIAAFNEAVKYYGVTYKYFEEIINSKFNANEIVPLIDSLDWLSNKIKKLQDLL